MKNENETEWAVILIIMCSAVVGMVLEVRASNQLADLEEEYIFQKYTCQEMKEIYISKTDILVRFPSIARTYRKECVGGMFYEK